MYQYHADRDFDFRIIQPEDIETCRLMNIKNAEDQQLQAQALDLIRDLRSDTHTA